MAKVKTEAQYAVETAVEFEKLDMLKQEAFEIAVDILKKTKKLAREEVEKKEEEDGGSVQEPSVHGQTRVC